MRGPTRPPLWVLSPAQRAHWADGPGGVPAPAPQPLRALRPGGNGEPRPAADTYLRPNDGPPQPPLCALDKRRTPLLQAGIRHWSDHSSLSLCLSIFLSQSFFLYSFRPSICLSISLHLSSFISSLRFSFYPPLILSHCTSIVPFRPG